MVKASRWCRWGAGNPTDGSGGSGCIGGEIREVAGDSWGRGWGRLWCGVWLNSLATFFYGEAKKVIKAAGALKVVMSSGRKWRW